MTRHQWRDRNEEGETVLYRADHHNGGWKFSWRRKSDDRWTHCESLELEEMEKFRGVLWNKHLRRRLPLHHVEGIDKILEKLRKDGTQD